jgi:hypothetical protein
MTGATPPLKQRRFLALALVAVCVVGVGVLFAACSGSDKKSSSTPSTNAVKTKNPNTPLKIGSANLASWGPTTQVPKAAQQAVLASANNYVNAAVLTPLETGKVGDGYANLFDAGVRGSATTSDQDALTELPVGKIDKYTEKTTPVAINGLADGSGAIVYLSTNFAVTTSANTTDGKTTLNRDVELTFVPQGKNWVISAYRIAAVRKLPTGSTTTVANAGGKP